MDGRETQAGRAPPRRPRVLVLIKCMGHGGAERLVVSMMRHRDRQRFDYEVAYVLEDRDTLVPQLERRASPCIPWASRGNYDLRWTGAPALPSSRRGRLRHRAFAPPYAATFGRLVAATPARSSPVARVHRAQHVGQDGGGRQDAEQGSERLDDRLFVVSEAVRHSLPTSLRGGHGWWSTGSSSNRSRGQSRRGEFRRKVRAELGLSDGELLALTVANFRWQKGHDVLLPAARSIVDRGAGGSLRRRRRRPVAP